MAKSTVSVGLQHRTPTAAAPIDYLAIAIAASTGSGARGRARAPITIRSLRRNDLQGEPGTLD
jgi:hypothetical protein